MTRVPPPAAGRARPFHALRSMVRPAGRRQVTAVPAPLMMYHYMAGEGDPERLTRPWYVPIEDAFEVSGDTGLVGSQAALDLLDEPDNFLPGHRHGLTWDEDDPGRGEALDAVGVVLPLGQLLSSLADRNGRHERIVQHSTRLVRSVAVLVVAQRARVAGRRSERLSRDSFGMNRLC